MLLSEEYENSLQISMHHISFATAVLYYYYFLLLQMYFRFFMACGLVTLVLFLATE